MSFLNVALQSSALVVAVDPGKVSNRVWLSDGAGMVVEPLTIPVSRDGIASLERLVVRHGPARTQLVFSIVATGSLHRPWASELERRHPGTVRLFAPSETKAARTQLGSGRSRPTTATAPP